VDFQFRQGLAARELEITDEEIAFNLSGPGLGIGRMGRTERKHEQAKPKYPATKRFHEPSR
jgi:hypothetical protein